MQVNGPRKREFLNNDNYFKLFELSYDAIFIIAADGGIQAVNKAACNLFKYSRDELLASELNNLFLLPEPDTISSILQTGPNSEENTLIGFAVAKDGSKNPVELKTTCIYDIDGNYFALVAHDITDRQEAQSALKQNEYLNSLHDTAVGLLNQLDLSTLLHSIVNRSCKLFGSPDGYICFVTEPENQLELSIGTGRYEKFIGYKFTIGKGITGLAAKRGEPMVIENYQKWPGHLKDPCWLSLHTGTAMPLKSFGKVVGVLGVDFFNHPRSFSANESLILNRLAQLASIALNNASLHSSLADSERKIKKSMEKAEHQNRYLTSLHETSLGLLNNLDINDVLIKIMINAADLFGTENAFIYELNNTKDLLTVKVGIGHSSNLIGYTIDSRSGVAGWVAQTGQPLLIEDYHNWPDRLTDSAWDALISCVGIPLHINNEVIGVIGLDFFEQKHSFSEEEMLVLNRFAELASIALANAKLHSDLAESKKLLQQNNESLTATNEELLATEEELRQQFNELIINEEEIHRQNIVLSTLHNTALGMMNRLNPNEVLKLIVTNATQFLQTEHGVIYLFSDKKDVVEEKISLGYFAEVKEPVLKTTEGLIGCVYKSGELMAVDDYSTWEGRLSNPIWDNLHALVEVPLKSEDKIMGIFILAFLTPSRKFTPAEISLLSRFADLASIALDNAKLFASYQSKLEEHRKTEEALRISEKNYRTIFEAVNDPIHLYNADTFEILDINAKAVENYGNSRPELLFNESPEHLRNQPFFREVDAATRIKQALTGEPQSFEWMVETQCGDIIWEEVNFKKVLVGNRNCILEVARDISERKKTELELLKSEADNKALINAIPDPMLIMKNDGTLLNYKGRIELLRFLPKNAMGRNIASFLPVEVAQKMLQSIKTAVETGETQVFEYQLPGQKTEYYEARVVSSGDDEALTLIRNITDRKSMEIQLKHLSLHDSLTGLYNRAFFEDSMKRLEGSRNASAGLMICDVDGLKIINDTLGHNIGDIILKEVAKILKTSFRKNDLVARIGGDEFAVMLPHNSLPAFEAESNKIKHKIELHNIKNPTFPISLSIGFAVSMESPVDLTALFKEADNNMYREKLHRHNSGRSAVVQALMKALEARDFITEGHGDRLQGLIVSFATTIGMPEREFADLRLLAKFHDIGKVGIPDSILFKPGKLTEEEFTIMRQHCEIGYRIAKSAPDLVPIADLVLKHQEWWNGAGYPLGISGEEIPLACRMLSIVDAFDAMTSDRPYRKAMPIASAIKEIKKCSGIQFDPYLVTPFITLVKGKANLR